MMDDDALLDALRDALSRFDPVPEATRRVARGAPLLSDLDVELAAILEDSLVDDEARAGVRSAGLPRLVVFAAGEIEIEIEVHEGPDGRRVIGQLAPAGPARVKVRTPAGDAAATDADAVGRFALPLPGGPVSLRIERPGELAVATAWLAL